MTEANEPVLAAVPIPPELPGMCLFGTVVFPLDVVSVQINQPRSLRMIADNPGESAVVACFFPSDPEATDASAPDDFLPVGVACRVMIPSPAQRLSNAGRSLRSSCCST